MEDITSDVYRIETACSRLRALRMKNNWKEWKWCIWKWPGSKTGSTVSNKSVGPGLSTHVWGHSILSRAC